MESISSTDSYTLQIERMKGIATKPKSRITHANRNENSIYNLICTLQQAFYNSHNTIYHMVIFEFFTFLAHSTGIARSGSLAV